MGPYCAVKIWFVVGSLRSQKALEGLRKFKLSEAECHDENDREALLALIGDWFTDHTSGETDRNRLRQVGWHRFENVVKNDLPLLIGKTYGSGLAGTVRTEMIFYGLMNYTQLVQFMGSPDYTLQASQMFFWEVAEKY